MTVAEIMEKVETNGGITLDASLNEVSYPAGYQVSLSGRETRISREIWLYVLDPILRQYQGIADGGLGPSKKIGLWNDDGFIYIDISIWVEDFSTAKATAQLHRQKAIFDWANKESIPVDAPPLFPS